MSVPAAVPSIFRPRRPDIDRFLLLLQKEKTGIFFAKMNFSDAIYNIENILKECIIIDDKAKL